MEKTRRMIFYNFKGGVDTVYLYGNWGSAQPAHVVVRTGLVKFPQKKSSHLQILNITADLSRKKLKATVLESIEPIL